MNKQTKKAFTLVELIVVITILAILGTIAFISFQGYSSQARDSRRISDIQNIKKSLELFSLNTGKYPLPDNGEEVSYSGELLWTQGVVGDRVARNLGRNLNTKPTDPLLELEYNYSVINSETKYELLSIYESDIISYNNLFDQTNAANNAYPKIDGNYNGVFVKTTNYYLPIPSLITSEDIAGGLTINSTNIKSQIITGGNNILSYGSNPPKTLGLTDMKLSVYDGVVITKKSSEADKKLLAEKIIGAYTGSILVNRGIYKTILETPENKLAILIDGLVLNNGSINISGNSGNQEEQTTWCAYEEIGFSDALGWTSSELKYDETTSKCYVFGDEDSNAINACNKWVIDNVTLGGSWIWVPARNFVTDGNGMDLKDSFYQREVVYNDNTYVCRGFAVMKYEAKFEGNQQTLSHNDWQTRACSDYETDNDTFCATIDGTTKITSTKENFPISKIRQGEAIYACKGGTINKYHLITNNEWMAIARNIEAQSINLKDGDKLYRGINGGSGQINEDGSLGCGITGGDILYFTSSAGIDNSSLSSTRTSCNDMRQNKLSNNVLIWDIAGNVWEHVNKSNIPGISNDRNSNNGWNGGILNGGLVGINGAQEWNNSNISVTELSNYGPVSSKDNLNGVGLIYDYDNNGGIFLHGGGGSYGTHTGIYTLYLMWGSSSYSVDVGVRCAW